MSKVCIIGLDGGTFTVIDYLAGQGRLPNFARMMAEGSRAVLMSSIPPITPAAWSSFYMGTNPGKHGSVGFFRFRSGTYRLEPMNSSTVRGTSLWSLASGEKRKVCVYDVPVTYPASPLNGIMISGMDAPRFDDRSVFPVEQHQKILDAIPNFDISSSVDYRYLDKHHPDPEAECIRQLQAHLEIEIETVTYLTKQGDWDLFVAVFRSTDIFQHLFWDSTARVIAGAPLAGDERRAESVFRVYERIDEEIGGRWRGWLEGRDLVLMSDHGFGELRSEVCLNRFLAEAGLLEFQSGGGSSRSRRIVKDKVKDHLPRTARRRLKKAVGMDNTDRRWNLFVDSLVADIDFARTRIFSIAQFGCLYVNHRGRNTLAPVKGETERNSVISETEKVLARFVDPQDGSPLVSRIFRREELYHGSLMEEMPDLVIELRDHAYLGIYNTAEELERENIICGPPHQFGSLSYTGTHRREGILVLSGPSVRRARLNAANIVDIAPTVAGLLGLPPLADWDGRVLEEALTGGSTVTEPGSSVYGKMDADSRGRVYSEEDEEEIRKRLKNLGYL